MKTKMYARFCLALLICFHGHFSWAQAPASLTGLTFDVTITSAGGGDNGSGSYTISFSPSVATINYQGHIKTSSYGYSIISPGTGKVVAAAADGSSNFNTIYFYFTDPNNGTYSSTNTSGSYENGTFAVTPPSLVLSTPGISSGAAKFTFVLSGPAGSNYVLQVSTNLQNWSSVSTSTIPVSGSVNLTNTIGGNSRGFYRVQLQ